MKVLKLFFVAFTLIFAFSSISNAQSDNKPMKLKKTPEQVAEKKAKKMQEKLGLSSDQYSQVYTILYNAAMERSARKTSGEKLTKEQRKAYMQDINTKIESVLTAEQLSQWQKYKSDHKGKNKKRNKNKGQDKRSQGQSENQSQGEFFKKEPCSQK